MTDNQITGEVFTASAKRTGDSEANIQVIKQSYAEFKKGNIEGVLANCADDVQWDTYNNPSVPFNGTYKGKDEVRRYFKLLNENITITRFDQKEFIGQGETVVVLSHQTSTVKRTGKTIDQEVAQVFRLRGGKVTSMFIFNDTRQVAKAFE